MLKQILCILVLTLCCWLDMQPVQAAPVNFESGAAFKQIYSDKFTEWYVDMATVGKAADKVAVVHTKLHEKRPADSGISDRYRIERYNLANHTSAIVAEYDYDADGKLVAKNISDDEPYFEIVPKSFEDQVYRMLAQGKDGKMTIKVQPKVKDHSQEEEETGFVVPHMETMTFVKFFTDTEAEYFIDTSHSYKTEGKQGLEYSAIIKKQLKKPAKDGAVCVITNEKYWPATNKSMVTFSQFINAKNKELSRYSVLEKDGIKYKIVPGSYEEAALKALPQYVKRS
jgi:hypothetical protein